MSELVLIVDDDPVQRRILENMTARFGYEVLAVEGGDAAIKALFGPNPLPIDCVLLDLVMPDLDGLGVLARLREAASNLPVIVQTAPGGIDNVISAMRAGAVDFVVKPVGAERLQVSLRNALNSSALQDELQRQKRSRTGTLTLGNIPARSPAMRAALHMAQAAASGSSTVLIQGEPGVGKELIARAIHGDGERRARPFVAINCRTAPEHLIESLMFGPDQGSLTGARSAGEISGGTLFLDEISELPLPAQAGLLRAIAPNEIGQSGARPTAKFDVRLIAASSLNLEAAVKDGQLREDLFDRLRTSAIVVPPLRERREDIPDLTRHLLARFNAEEGKRVRGISTAAIDRLCAYSWPGNVRELEDVLLRAVMLAPGDTIDVNEIALSSPEQLHARQPTIGARASATVGGSIEPFAHDSEVPIPMVLETCGQDGPLSIAPSVPHGGTEPAGGELHWLSLLDASGEVRPLEAIESEVIRFAIAHYRGQMSEVARRLQIGRSTLYRKLKDLGLENGESLLRQGENVATK